MTGAPRRAAARRGTAVLLVLVLAGVGAASCTDDGGSSSSPTLVSGVDAGAPGFDGLFDQACDPEPDPIAIGGEPVAFSAASLTIAPADGDPVEGCYLVADTPEGRGRGLMETEDLGGFSGMVFVFEADANSGFYMKDTLIPLSIAWFTAEGEFVSSADMEPCPAELAEQDECPTFAAAGDYRYAIEVPEGELEAVGIDGPGSTLQSG